MNLPGIVADRFFALASNNSKDLRVHLITFERLILDVFSPNEEDRLRVAFRLFDFNSDGKVTPQDVKLILNYLPMTTASD